MDRKFSDFHILIFLALVRLAVHTLTNGEYGFHRDELAILDEARHLAVWGEWSRILPGRCPGQHAPNGGCEWERHDGEEL